MNAIYVHPICWILIEMPTPIAIPVGVRTALEALHRSRVPQAELSINAATDGKRYLIKVAATPGEIGVGNVTRIFTVNDHHQAYSLVSSSAWAPPAGGS